MENPETTKKVATLFYRRLKKVGVRGKKSYEPCAGRKLQIRENEKLFS